MLKAFKEYREEWYKTIESKYLSGESVIAFELWLYVKICLELGTDGLLDPNFWKVYNEMAFRDKELFECVTRALRGLIMFSGVEGFTPFVRISDEVEKYNNMLNH